MPWIKRNLIFVICLAVGVILLGGSGYFLFTSMKGNAAAAEDLRSATSQYDQLLKKVPFPSPENIQLAKDQQQEVQELLTQVKSAMPPFPVPPKTDEKGFKSALDRGIARLQESARAARVEIPTNYAFSFSGITTKLSFPPECIDPWMQQLQEINALCDILYRSKINYLDGILRVPIGTDESGADYVAASSITNDMGVITPYQITFRSFTPEVATVLNNFQDATNCFVVKDVEIQRAGDVSATSTGDPAPVTGGQYRGTSGQTAAAANTPVTILSEKLLRVTLIVDIIKPKSP